MNWSESKRGVRVGVGVRVRVRVTVRSLEGGRGRGEACVDIRDRCRNSKGIRNGGHPKVRVRGFRVRV